MSALAAEHDAINLGQGYPDTDGPAAMLQAAVDAILGGRNQYPPGIGIPELRRAVAAHQERHYGLRPDPDTGTLVTTGATEAITAAVLALTQPGDEILALEPWFDSYPAAATLAGCRLVGIPLQPPDFRPDPERLAAAVTARTRLIILNTPHNPTGLVLTSPETEAIARVCLERDLLVVADEVYEHLVFDGRRHHPIAAEPGMFERTVTVGSAGKQFSVTGWKVGWASGPADLIAAVRAVKQYLTYVSAGPLQPAVALALDTEDAWVAEQTRRMQDQRDLLINGLRGLGLTTFDSAGTSFVVSDAASWGHRDGMAFSEDLVRSAGVATIGCQAFTADPSLPSPLVRWTFGKQASVLQEALERLAGSRGAATQGL